MGESNIPRRPIGRSEEEVLDKIWGRLVVPERRPELDVRNYNELQGRIRQAMKRRRHMYGMLAGVFLLLFPAVTLMFWPLKPLPESEALAQLEEMGVTIDHRGVILTADDGTKVALDDQARLEQRAEGTVALCTQAGEERVMARERKLRVEVPDGQQFQLTLSDGSQVWLNARSALEYPATFDRVSERRVKIRGEAFFEVRRDAECPFCVELAHGECIRVKGTSFNVSADTVSGCYVTTLVSGRIGYTADGTAEVELKPNQQLRRDVGSGTTELQAVDASLFSAWKDGWLWFENESLPDLADRLGRVYGIRVEVAERLAKYTFSGKIRQERGIEYVLNLLSETSDVHCEVNDGVMRFC